jgi:hypothetical protein
MSDVIAVALITGLTTGLATLAGILITQKSESSRRDLQSRDGREEARLARAHERATQRRDAIQDDRRRQATEIRTWIRNQLTAGVDIDHLRPGALTHGQNPVYAEMAAAALVHVNALIAARSASPEAMSVNRVLADVSSLEVVTAVRAMPDLGKAMRDALAPMVEIVKATPMPWTDQQLELLWQLNEPLTIAQHDYDERLASLNRLLESYVAGYDLEESSVASTHE